MTDQDNLRGVIGAKAVSKDCGCSLQVALQLIEIYGDDPEGIATATKHFKKWGADTTHNLEDEPDAESMDIFKADDASMPITPLECKNDLGSHWSDTMQLPRLPARDGLVPAGSYAGSQLKLSNVIGAIQQGESYNTIQKHLAYYSNVDDEKLRKDVNREVKRFPAIFYIVETDNLEMIKCWVKYGGNVNATCGREKLPLLAFTIMQERSTRTLQQATKTLELLLSLGASASVIPRGFHTRSDGTLQTHGQVDPETSNMIDAEKGWCKDDARDELASAMNLTQRYRLAQATRTGPPSRRRKIVVSRANAEMILGLQYTVVGQEATTSALKQRLISQLALPGDKPLVLMFAGPSGHGKTELAQGLGTLISAEILSIDCSSFQREDEMFGAWPSYSGWESGSQLNNFLAKMSGQRSIVFMDEFEKTSTEVRNALLIPFDQGIYCDRRNKNRIDCSKTIWILATNQFDAVILLFCRLNKEVLHGSGDDRKKKSLWNGLRATLKTRSRSDFGAPLTGRISDILPFLTFSPDEQAVLAHKGVMSLESNLKRPVVISVHKQADNLVGNVHLDLRNDTDICNTIAHASYDPPLGARSILNAVTEKVYIPLVDQYLDIDEELSEEQPETLFEIGVNADKEIEVWQVNGDGTEE